MNRSRHREEFGRSAAAQGEQSFPAVRCTVPSPFRLNVEASCGSLFIVSEGFHLPKIDRGQAGANITDDAPQNKRQDAIDAISPSCALTELGIAGI
jgi:hypothetical protein